MSGPTGTPRQETPAERRAREETLRYLQELSRHSSSADATRARPLASTLPPSVVRTTIPEFDIALDDPVARRLIAIGALDASNAGLLAQWGATCPAIPDAPAWARHSVGPIPPRVTPAAPSPGAVLHDYFVNGFTSPELSAMLGAGNAPGNAVQLWQAAHARAATDLMDIRMANAWDRIAPSGQRTMRINSMVDLYDANAQARLEARRAGRPIPPNRADVRMRVKVGNLPLELIDRRVATAIRTEVIGANAGGSNLGPRQQQLVTRGAVEAANAQRFGWMARWLGGRHTGHGTVTRHRCVCVSARAGRIRRQPRGSFCAQPIAECGGLSCRTWCGGAAPRDRRGCDGGAGWTRRRDPHASGVGSRWRGRVGRAPSTRVGGTVMQVVRMTRPEELALRSPMALTLGAPLLMVLALGWGVPVWAVLTTLVALVSVPLGCWLHSRSRFTLRELLVHDLLIVFVLWVVLGAACLAVPAAIVSATAGDGMTPESTRAAWRGGAAYLLLFALVVAVSWVWITRRWDRQLDAISGDIVRDGDAHWHFPSSLDGLVPHSRDAAVIVVGVVLGLVPVVALMLDRPPRDVREWLAVVLGPIVAATLLRLLPAEVGAHLLLRRAMARERAQGHAGRTYAALDRIDAMRQETWFGRTFGSAPAPQRRKN
jgi:hypothetical protein